MPYKINVGIDRDTEWITLITEPVTLCSGKAELTDFHLPSVKRVTSLVPYYPSNSIFTSYVKTTLAPSEFIGTSFLFDTSSCPTFSISVCPGPGPHKSVDNI